jgi:heme ABC exporter ATP-binding subunit CcmA
MHPDATTQEPSDGDPDADRVAAAEAHPAVESPVVDLADVVAVLGAFPVLAGATMQVRRGEVVLLRGPNGAGKTSLLRLCAGLLPLARGTGTVFGLDLLTDREAIRPRVGLLGHRNGLYTDLTVAENVAFWGATVGASDAEIAGAMVRLAVDGRLRDVPVRSLSAGQKRRTALACLVARRAELWLLDEPHAGLDAAGRDELDAVLRQAVASGATVVVASHELDRAGSLADRVVDVVGGRVVDGRGVDGRGVDPMGEPSP